MLHAKFTGLLEKIFEDLYNIWAWGPSRLFDLDHLNWFPHLFPRRLIMKEDILLEISLKVIC